MKDWFHGFFDKEYVAILRDQKADATRSETNAVVRALRLPKASRILDVGCGFGRVSLELARRGYEVVGVDLSKAMLAEARRRNTDGAATFLHADMRRLQFRSEFDGVISVFTSFGYFSQAGNEKALRAMARALRPGGKILIDTVDRDHLDRHFMPRHWQRARDGFILVDTKYDASTGRTHGTWFLLRLGRKQVFAKSMDILNYTVGQMKTMFRRAGLRYVRAYGGYDLKPRKLGETRRLIIIGERVG